MSSGGGRARLRENTLLEESKEKPNGLPVTRRATLTAGAPLLPCFRRAMTRAEWTGRAGDAYRSANGLNDMYSDLSYYSAYLAEVADPEWQSDDPGRRTTGTTGSSPDKKLRGEGGTVGTPDTSLAPDGVDSSLWTALLALSEDHRINPARSADDLFADVCKLDGVSRETLLAGVPLPIPVAHLAALAGGEQAYIIASVMYEGRLSSLALALVDRGAAASGKRGKGGGDMEGAGAGMEQRWAEERPRGAGGGGSGGGSDPTHGGGRSDGLGGGGGGGHAPPSAPARITRGLPQHPGSERQLFTPEELVARLTLLNDRRNRGTVVSSVELGSATPSIPAPSPE
jgi:hypothetical protein